MDLVVWGWAFIVISLVLLLHHGYHHSYDPPDSAAQLESCPEVCYFQLNDISNHETWVLVFLTNGITLLLVGLTHHVSRDSL